MKKTITLLTGLFLLTFPCFSQQAKKPTIMVLPSDNWCIQRYYTRTFDNQGIRNKVIDYQRAFQEDLELKQVITKVREMLINLNYEIKDCEQEIKNINNRTAENNITISNTSSASIVESPLDILKKRVKSDIIITIDWNTNRKNNETAITFILNAIDTYSSRNIASISSTGKQSSEIIAIQLEKIIKKQIPAFDLQLQNYFRDISTNGREVSLTIRCWDNWDKNLETEFNDEELIDLIQIWLRKNTVHSAFNLTDNTETTAYFEQVRIPFFDNNKNALDARSFAIELRKYLSKEPLNITSKIIVRGLGEATLILGEK